MHLRFQQSAILCENMHCPPTIFRGVNGRCWSAAPMPAPTCTRATTAAAAHSTNNSRALVDETTCAPPVATTNGANATPAHHAPPLQQATKNLVTGSRACILEATGHAPATNMRGVRLPPTFAVGLGLFSLLDISGHRINVTTGEAVRLCLATTARITWSWRPRWSERWTSHLTAISIFMMQA